MATVVPRFRIRTRMAARDADESHRTSSPLEALFDLTFVVAVAQVADQLAGKVESGQFLDGVVSFVMVFFAIWWAWVNFTWFASAYDNDDVIYRLTSLLQMGGVLVLAAGVPVAFEHHNFFGITLGYLIMRIGLVAQWVRAAMGDPAGRVTALRYAGGVTVVQALWVLRLVLPTDPADVWWTVYLAFVVLAGLDMLVPWWAERTGQTSWHPHHIAERFGLFAIILLGETIAVTAAGAGAVVSAGDRVGVLVVVGIAALVLIFGTWWMYFLQPSGEGLEANRRGGFYWGYGHYFMFAALGALGAGLEVVLRFAGGHQSVEPRVAAFTIGIPIAVFLVSLVIAHLRILPGIAVHFWIVVPVAVIELLVPLAADAIGLPVAFVLMALVVALAVAATMIYGRRATMGREQ